MPPLLDRTPNRTVQIRTIGSPLLVLWITACAYLNISGWLLSLLHSLDFVGYALISIPGILGLWYSARIVRSRDMLLRGDRLKWRIRHVLPLLFHIGVLLVFAGGTLYPPNNYDALTYRIPRLLNWLAEHRWHWIPTDDVRFNISGTGMEWLSAPLISLLGTDRPLFLLNAVPYLFMPGLIFSVFTQLGVSARMAWYWMWLLPMGYGYILQAGSAGNDLLSGLYFLSALHFVLKGSREKRLGPLLLGALATALMTGVKASNLPLLLPLGLATAPAWRLLLMNWRVVLPVLSLLLSVSFLPTALANFNHCGAWDGDPQNTERMKLKNPGYGIAGNSLQMATVNLSPPIVPFASSINAACMERGSSPLLRTIEGNFPRFRLAVSELAQEEGAGIGLGISSLLLCSLIARLYGVINAGLRMTRVSVWAGIIIGGSWISFFFYMAVLGSESTPRIALPYYPALVASILMFLPPTLSDRKWWRLLAALAALSSLTALILTPARPLWPALTLLERLHESRPESVLWTRAWSVYAVYRNRSKAFDPLVKLLPVGAKHVGLIGSDVPETSLWRPFGSRRIWRLTPDNAARVLKRIQVVVGAAEKVQAQFGVSPEDWAMDCGMLVAQKDTLTLKASKGAEQWFIAIKRPRLRKSTETEE